MKTNIFHFGIGGCALSGGLWLWLSLFKYFEHFFCWPPAWELLWSWILMSSGVNTHCDPPSCTFSDPFSSNRVFQKFPPLGPSQSILHFLWKIKLCNLLLDPSEPTPPSLSLFIDSTALQWEKNSQADGLAQKKLKRFTADIKNSNVATQTSVQKGTWWKLRVSSPSLGLLPWPRPLIKVLLFHRCVLTLLTLQSIFQQSKCASDPILNTFIVWTSTLLLLSESHFALWSTPAQ